MVKSWILALLMLLAPLAAQAAQPAETANPAAFTRAFLERLQREAPELRLEISGPLQLRILDQNDAIMNLDRVYNFCTANAADECEEATSRFIASMRESFRNLDTRIERAQLRLMVRGSDYCAELARMQAQAPNAQRSAGTVTRPAGPGLCAILVVDFPQTMRIANAANLSDLSLDPDAAWTLAEQQTIGEAADSIGNAALANSMVVFAEEDYIPSLMLAHDGWRRAVARNGELIVAVPADNHIIAIRRALVPDLAGLRTLIRDAYQTAERGISPMLYRWTDAGWEEIR